MSEHDGAQASIKQRRSRRTNATPQQNGKQTPAAQRPAYDDKEAWKTYWQTQGQHWRTEPEIDAERQTYLTEQRRIMPDMKQGIYPFKDIDPKLSRADVEWLLETHENGRGPVDWKDERQRERDGLDLRGADLSQEDLSDLPLARMLGGHPFAEWRNATEEQRHLAAACMNKANLIGTQLQGANLPRVQLQGASLDYANLRGAYLREAQLQGVPLFRAQLQGAYLTRAQLQGANFREAQLDSVHLYKAVLTDEKYGTTLLTDVKWGEINLAVVDWTPVKMLGDEFQARQRRNADGLVKDEAKQFDELQAAVRANRQLGVVLRDQGLNEIADRFAYRAQLMQGKVFWYQGHYLKWLGSLFLDLLSGYGYKPLRCFIAYLIVILTFASAYLIIGHKVGPVLSPLGSVVFSMTSFHGRGFFPGGIALDDPMTVVAALEAFIGLLIEVTFIATLTQRLFGK